MADPMRNFPFRRALAVDPIIIPVGVTGAATLVPKALLQTQGVTSFKMCNPNPFWVWYRGWSGAAGAMPTIAGLGHYIAPGGVDINTSQVPDYIAAVAEDEPGFPIYDGSTYIYAGKRTRLVMVYGSGS